MSLALPCDPAVTSIAAAALSVIFLLAAWHKLRDIDSFESAAAAYRLLPAAWIRPFARLLPALEAVAGMGLLFAVIREHAAWLALGLLFVMTGAVAINLARGIRDIDCGCGSAPIPLSPFLVARNLVLAGGLIVAMQASAPRALHWLDYVTVAGGTLALLGLYAAGNELLATHTRAQEARNHA